MKTPKIRIWNPAGKKMLHDIENVYECLKQQLVFDKSQLSRGFTFPYDHMSEGMVWMLFTGKKDKNGVEIYDGDILSEMVEVDGEMKASIEPIFYSDKEAAFCVDISFSKDRSSYELFNENDRSNLEVIGNIYESSELVIERLEKKGLKA